MDQKDGKFTNDMQNYYLNQPDFHGSEGHVILYVVECL